MSQEKDIETIRAGYEAFGRGDWDAVVGDAAPDFEVQPSDRFVRPKPFRGVAEARQFFRELFEPFEEVTAEPERFIGRGERIVVFLVVRARPRGSRAVVENEIAHLWTMRDGKAARLQIFPEREKALAAMGLSE